MKGAVLLGSPNAKRTLYFKQAADQLGLPVSLLEWEEWKQNKALKPYQQSILKIDPPVWSCCSLNQLKDLSAEYEKDLTAMEGGPWNRFFNHPQDILKLLDKRGCKKRLKEANIPVTEMLEGSFQTPEQLLSAMASHQMPQVFLKPVSGSGAAGVTAFRINPRTGKAAAYTCALPTPKGLINTKKLRAFYGFKEVLPLLEQLLCLDCIAERWYPKAVYQGYSYDLRAVFQEGRVDFLLARLSKGPVTNLHLNNHPLKAEALNLPRPVLASIFSLCSQAAACYPRLSSVGIDILLEKGSLTPRIIELNGQGDLLYEDIYNDNSIYLHQASMMQQWITQTR